MYAPEPFDVGRVLQAEIISDGQQFTLTTTCAIDPGLYLICFSNLVFVFQFLLTQLD